MRPRHKAAENHPPHGRDGVAARASMRPRHKAAENARIVGHPRGPEQASMRPRHKAAENSCKMRQLLKWVRSFNEAAA